MKQNVGSIDRAIRAIVGIGLISLVFLGPPYSLLGINTCKKS